MYPLSIQSAKKAQLFVGYGQTALQEIRQRRFHDDLQHVHRATPGVLYTSMVSTPGEGKACLERIQRTCHAF